MASRRILWQNTPDEQTPTPSDLLDGKVKSMVVIVKRWFPLVENIEMRHQCKVCGTEDTFTLIKNHIESNHLEGKSIPCDNCGKICPTRASLGMHKSRYHEWIEICCRCSSLFAALRKSMLTLKDAFRPWYVEWKINSFSEEGRGVVGGANLT